MTRSARHRRGNTAATAADPGAIGASAGPKF
jgi:hypothetical protein